MSTSINNEYIDSIAEDLTSLYDNNVYTNGNNEVSAVMVNECFATTAVELCELLKKFVTLDVKITAYYGLNLIPDENNPNKSYINATSDEGWLVRVDIPRLINYLYYSSSGEYTMLHSILTPTSGLANWNPDNSYVGVGFGIFASTYDNVTWAQGETWTYQRELQMWWPPYEYTLFFFVQKQGNLVLIPDLGIANEDEYYWQDGAGPVSFMTPYEYSRATHNGGQTVQVDFKIKDLLTYLVE